MILMTMCQDLHSINIKRGTIFLATSFIVISIQFLYCFLAIVYLKIPFLEVGGPIFIAYTICDFVVVFITLVATLYQGAEANQIDSEFKNWIYKHSSIVMLAKSNVQRGEIFKKDGQLDIIKEVAGHKVSSRMRKRVSL